MPRRAFRIDPKLFDHAEFQRAVNSHDQLAVLLRTHAYVEASLLDLIESQLPSPEAMDWSSRIGFEDKLNLAIALELVDPSEKPAYIKLNALRNKVAHNPRASVTAGEVQDLIDTLNPVQRWVFVGALEREPLPGRDLQGLISVLFLNLATRLPLAQADRAKPTGRLRRYQASVREAQRHLERFRLQRSRQQNRA